MLSLLLVMKTDRRFENQVTEVRLIVTLKDIANMTLMFPLKSFKKIKVVCSHEIWTRQLHTNWLQSI